MQQTLFRYIPKIIPNVIVIFIINFKYCETGMRILGGRDAHKDEFPFAVRLEIEITEETNVKLLPLYIQFCTGAALTSVWILTAAHCNHESPLFSFFTPIRNKTIVARYNSYFPQYLGNIAYILKTLSHPAFIYQDGKYDIALYLCNRIEVSHYAKISAIDYTTLIGYEVAILGFGRTNATLSGKPLQVLNGILIKCLKKDPKSITTLCLVPQCGSNVTICGGDSGGPVLHPSGIIGVNSKSKGDCDEHNHTIIPAASASVISVVSPVLDWISNIIANETMYEI